MDEWTNVAIGAFIIIGAGIAAWFGDWLARRDGF